MMRKADIVFGIFFVALGAAIAIVGDRWAYIVAAVLILLGVQAAVSGWRGRRSWLSRIGPLP